MAGLLRIRRLAMAMMPLLVWGCATVRPPAPYGPCPSEAQVRWQRMEMNMFCHFGPNTFSGREWGDGAEPEDLFFPTDLDCRQWARTAKAAGMKGVIVTAKHHDGFCLWPNPVSSHTVAQSQWRDGKGDVLKELADACQAEGLGMGVYISPWDRNAPDYGTPAYNETFRQTLQHALGSYGTIFEQWFDGANGEGPNGRKQIYDWDLFNNTVARLQPEAVVFSDVGPGCRWVGNENGVCGETCWSLLDTAGFTPGAGAPPLEVLNTGNPAGTTWVPAEADVSIRPGWFYHAAERPKGLQELLEIYYSSVGRNALLLLNVPPDTRGLISTDDSLRLMELRTALDTIFAHNLASEATITASHSRGRRFAPCNVVDTCYHTYWAVPDSCLTPVIYLDFANPVSFNRIMLQEYIPLGQRVERFRVEAFDTHLGWQTIGNGTTIGYKRILLTPACTTRRLRIVVESSRACPVINQLGLYQDNILLPATPIPDTDTLSATLFGAVGNGMVLNTRCLQAAIDSAAGRYARTGKPAVVRIPCGQFVTGTLYLKSGVTLHLDSGAVLLGSLNPFDYVKDSLCRWTALLFAVGQHHIGLSGSGSIDCRGWQVANNTVNLIHLGLINDPLKYDRPNETNRPEIIHFRQCNNVTVKHVTLRNPASWCQQYDQCDNLLIDGINVDSKCYWNNDGLDIVDCRNVVVRNCNIDASDDAYCFKSHSPQGISENILVENCVGRSSANGIKFGTVTRGVFRHFLFRNILIHDTYRSALTIASVDGAIIEDITVDSLRSINTGNPFFLRLASRNATSLHQATLRDITIKNLYAEVPYSKPDAGYPYEGPVEDQPRNTSPSTIAGTPGLRITGITLQNIELVYPGLADTTYAYRGTSPAELAARPEYKSRYPEFSMWKELPAYGLYLRHADSITLHNVTFRLRHPDYRPAIVADDVNLLTLQHTSAPQSPSPQLVAHNTTHLRHTGRRLKTRLQHSSPLPPAPDLPVVDPVAHPPIFKASLFGCKSNGTTLNTNSIQRAVDHIAAHGGGTLLFEVGRYLTGSVHLPSSVHIHLNEGAILVGSPNPHDYDTSSHGRPALLLYTTPPDRHTLGLGRIELPQSLDIDAISIE